ncbi:MAG TPA: helix-turn-helix domain-containing protein [Tenuifilaceae bacterium]|nr:helix-turn-helix domain-containing protein [Tenuifilaceae bacterium]HPI44290.1 helix-turn-helix domain-containing protein [Tenuifilaceae bacterium]HPN20885.1 helix-turn-helix domain-containing protein [Tenuifilaceae bacterium]
MNVELVTKDDLRSLESNLLNKVEQLIKGKASEYQRRWYKTKDLEELFGISKGKQQDLRNKNVLPFTKIGVTIYYSVEDIERILEDNKSAI